jgi:Ca2+-binding EF-hand superfamily protein
MSDDHLVEYFNASDKDGSGYLTATELQECLSNGSWKPFSMYGTFN